MAFITLTEEQLKALLQLGENQLFRLRFIDPKIPGRKNNPEQLKAAESAVQKLEAALKRDRFRRPTEWERPTRHASLQRQR